MPVRINNKDRANIIERFVAGEQMIPLAKEYNMSYGNVCYIISSYFGKYSKEELIKIERYAKEFKNFTISPDYRGKSYPSEDDL